MTAYISSTGTQSYTLPINAVARYARLWFANTSYSPKAVAEMRVFGAPTPSQQVSKYYFLGKQRLAMRQNGKLTYLHGDQLGSASLATDATGVTLSQQRYLPYGGLRWVQSGSVFPTDWQYTDQQRQATHLTDIRSVEYYDYRARMYDPKIGRFISPDSIVPDEKNPQSLNRYAYVYNNPIKYVDPSGHCPHPWCTALVGGSIGAIVGGAVNFAIQMSGDNEMNYGELAGSIAGGAVTGALVGSGAALFEGLVGGAIAGVAGGQSGAVAEAIYDKSLSNETLESAYDNGFLNPTHLVVQGALGAISSGIGGIIEDMVKPGVTAEISNVAFNLVEPYSFGSNVVTSAIAESLSSYGTEILSQVTNDPLISYLNPEPERYPAYINTTIYDNGNATSYTYDTYNDFTIYYYGTP